MAERKTREEKREVGQRSQKLARELMNLLDAKLAEVRLDDVVREEVEASRRHTAPAARRREERRLGGVLREFDMDDIEAALHEATADQRAEAARFKRTERWRTRLVEDDDGAAALATELGVPLDEAFVQAIDDARHERATGRPKGAGKKLFKLLRGLLDALE